MPAWKEAEGGITLCADTEVGIRWALLGGKKKKKKRKVKIRIQQNKKINFSIWIVEKKKKKKRTDRLFWLLGFALTPLETGREFPEADELEELLEAEVEEALCALITAARLKHVEETMSDMFSQVYQIVD